jgi:hypothetical protein
MTEANATADHGMLAELKKEFTTNDSEAEHGTRIDSVYRRDTRLH